MTKITTLGFSDLQWCLILFGNKTSVVFSSCRSACGTYCTQSESELRVVWRLTDKWLSAATRSVEQMSYFIHLRWANTYLICSEPISTQSWIVTCLAKLLYGDELILFATCHLIYTILLKRKKELRNVIKLYLLVKAAVESRQNRDALMGHFLLMSSLSNLADNKPLEILSCPLLPRPCTIWRLLTSTLLLGIRIYRKGLVCPI